MVLQEVVYNLLRELHHKERQERQLEEALVEEVQEEEHLLLKLGYTRCPLPEHRDS